MADLEAESDEIVLELGKGIDASSMLGDAEELLKLDQKCASLLKDDIQANKARLWYFRSNIHASLQEEEDPNSWNWRQPCREKQILYLRRAIECEDFAELPVLVCAQILTNLANQLNSLGRSIEAISTYNDALKLIPNFAMALANRGMSKVALAKTLHDRGHAALILLSAHEDFSIALSKSALWDGYYYGVYEQFQAERKKIESVIDVDYARNSIKLDSHSIGRTKIEKKYRTWILSHGLFLNPLNAMGPHAIAACDHFGLPSHKAKNLDDPPHFISWFNQLKQEFAAARLLMFESETTSYPHYADRKLSLVDTWDYSAYGIMFEKMRISFRVAYSLLDKVAGFINAYFELGEKPERVDLKNIWHTKNSKDIRVEFRNHHNLPLRGLYWLAFDITGDEPNDPDSIAPGAKALYRLRNALEHRCLSLKAYDIPSSPSIIESIAVDHFRAHTMEILKLAHASILYLSLSVASEERKKRSEETGIVMPMPLGDYQGPART